MNKEPSVICFGEILWDNLPDGRTAGGAPMNVAYHLNTIGATSQLISRIGHDQPGAQLKNFCHQISLPTALIQTDQLHPTSEVNAKIMANHEVVYDIVLNVAWDYISYEPHLGDLAGTADAFVFGSLSARNTTSRETLLHILDSAKFKIFDVNIRAPHYSKEILALLLQRANVLKLNNDELELLTALFYKKGVAESEGIKFIQQEFYIPEIIITKGSEGASYYDMDTAIHRKAYPVKVADTIGAGDSFLAAFIYKKLKGKAITEVLDYALGMGAFIASQNGACPAYTTTDLDNFIHQHNN
ncbi:carbohydrate kinase [Pedobacter sp. L105]|uniref:carbohydrate kinase family protein n=1 Tax=Pedobacter sp. L105 TaxID=1641871 RepID=UPI00131E0A9A|nr:carbohydrate kinase [Pedobacter sp. L105]